jgi:beta-lactamase regulating signal transducer with metallopeptidase domain
MSALTFFTFSGVAAYALNLFLHLTVICVAVLCAARLLFRRDPAIRHFLCLTGLVCLLLAPVLVGLETRAGGGLIKVALPRATTAVSLAANGPATTSRPETPYRVAIYSALPAQSPLVWTAWTLLAAYLLGVSGGALRLAVGCRKVRQLKHDIAPWQEAGDRVTLRQVEAALHAPAPPVFTSRHVESPVAIGLLHPVVILPEGLAETLAPRQLRHVLLHECAHIAFRHGYGGLLERVVGVLFWPHPLVQTLCRELARAREEICDNFASQEDGAACYARTLLAIAQGIAVAPNLTTTLALIGTGTSLEARVAGLLDPKRNRMISVQRGTSYAVVGAALLAMLTAAAFRVVETKESARQSRAGASPHTGTTAAIVVFPPQNADVLKVILHRSLSIQRPRRTYLAIRLRKSAALPPDAPRQITVLATVFGHLGILAAQAAKPALVVPAPARASVQMGETVTVVTATNTDAAPAQSESARTALNVVEVTPAEVRDMETQLAFNPARERPTRPAQAAQDQELRDLGEETDAPLTLDGAPVTQAELAQEAGSASDQDTIAAEATPKAPAIATAEAPAIATAEAPAIATAEAPAIATAEAERSQVTSLRYNAAGAGVEKAAQSGQTIDLYIVHSASDAAAPTEKELVVSKVEGFSTVYRVQVLEGRQLSAYQERALAQAKRSELRRRSRMSSSNTESAADME